MTTRQGRRARAAWTLRWRGMNPGFNRRCDCAWRLVHAALEPAALSLASEAALRAALHAAL